MDGGARRKSSEGRGVETREVRGEAHGEREGNLRSSG